MARLDWKKNNPVRMVGDGRTPNRFWVTASTDFNYMKLEKFGGHAVWCSDYATVLMKEHGIESCELIGYRAVFTTLAEAVHYATGLAVPAEPEPGGMHRITIEDRLNGEVWEQVLEAYPRKWGGWEFQWETDGTAVREDM